MSFAHLTPAQRTEIARKGGRARAQQFTSTSQKAARAQVKPESLRANGKKGFQATARKKGADFAHRLFARHRRKYPSALEKSVSAWLDELGISYKREHPLEDCYFDFYLPDDGLLIEADGAAFHGQTVHGEDRTGRDEQKNQIAARHGLPLLRLPEPTIHDGTALKIIKSALHPSNLPPIEPYYPPKFYLPVGHPFTR
jgi:very-short-patch-repair endonuclease